MGVVVRFKLGGFGIGNEIKSRVRSGVNLCLKRLGVRQPDLGKTSDKDNGYGVVSLGFGPTLPLTNVRSTQEHVHFLYPVYIYICE